MHPIERLRYVARAAGDDGDLVAREAAGALAAFGHDPAGLVTACRRLVQRHPTSGALWWLCSRVLVAEDPVAEAWAATGLLEEDLTPQCVARELPDDAVLCTIGWPALVDEALVGRGDVRVLAVDTGGSAYGMLSRLHRLAIVADEVTPEGVGAAAADADVVLLEAAAVGPAAFLAPLGSRAAAAVARHAQRRVWLVAGVGRLLPASVFDAMLGQFELGGEPWERPDELVPLDLVDRVVGPDGALAPAEALARTDCPVAPELLHSS